MAAGRPKPIVPRPPEERKLRGFSCVKNWQDHIWFWPTSVATITSPFVSRSTVARTDCGMIAPEGDSSQENGSSFFHCWHSATHAAWSALFTCGSRSRSTGLMSPTTGRSQRTLLAIDVGSTSTCTIFACGANSLTLPVTRSSKRAPIASSTSHASSALLAAIRPCMPIMCSESGSLSGNTPRPMSVVATGMFALCASSASSFTASALRTPPPA